MSSYTHLCFVFIPKYKSLVNKSICLDDRYVFDFDKDNYVLTVRKNENHIDHLWGKSIYSLTAIVGDNGAGKTTAIRYIMKMMAPGSQKKMDDGVYVVEENGILKVFSSREIGINYDFKEQKIKIEQINKEELFNEISIETFFYSAHFSVPVDLNPSSYKTVGGVYDGSDFYRLLYDYSNYCLVKTSDMDRPLREHVLGYNFQNWYRISLLLADRYDDMKNYGLEPPRFLLIFPYTSGENSFKSKGLQSEIPDFKRPLSSSLSVKKQAISLFIYNILLNMALAGNKVLKGVMDRLEDWIKMCNGTNINDSNFYISFEKLMCGGSKTSSKFVKDIIDLLSDIESKCEYSKDYSMLYLDLASKKNRAKLKQLLKYPKNFSDPLTERLFNMFYAHDANSNEFSLLSSGEQEMLNLFSRIYDAMNPQNMDFNQIGAIERKQLLFLDEAEIGYHPKWQKKYVNNLVKFLTIMTDEKDFFQVILTSHSPLILSDIPKSCTNYLATDGETIPKKETFGANIFDLYRSSFFMGNGLIGEFAWEKIKKVLKTISSKEHKSSDDDMTMEEAEKIIPLIGDDRIRDYLKEKLYKDNPQYAIDCYKRKIEELQSKINNE